jgi:drug/metabolite transporter (DMT)-like permease
MKSAPRAASASVAYLQIHLCVFLWGFTAILGKLITLDALPLVWWRMVAVSCVLALLPHVRRHWAKMPPRVLLIYAGIGSLVALHWVTFYATVKLANASVAATCIAFAPAFLAVVEPFVAGRRFRVRELLLGVAILPGVVLVLGGVPAGMYRGVAVGALSALLVATFGALNKRYLDRSPSPLAITGLELGAGALLLTLVMVLRPHTGPAFPVPGARDAALLGVLAAACTLLPFSLSLVALRHLSAFAAQLAVNLEPIYAALLAIPLLGEHHVLAPSFYVGLLWTVAIVALQPILAVRARPAAGPG